MSFDEGVASGFEEPIVLLDSNRKAAETVGLRGSGFVLSILDSSPDCIKFVELDGTLSFMNENGQCAMEVDDFCLIAGCQWSELWPKETAAAIAASVQAARGGKSTRIEAFCPTAKGTPKWWDVTVSPVFDADDKPERILSISRDITERIEREKLIEAREKELRVLLQQQMETLSEKERLIGDKDLLIREIDHRVKNSLAMVSTLLRLQAGAAPNGEVSRELKKAAERIITIAGVHDRLYRDRNVGQIEFHTYLGSLCEDLRRSLATEDVDFHCVSDHAELSADTATALGLCVSELVGNSIRHAFPGRKGTVGIHFSAGSNGSPSTLSVSDDGVGLPEGFGDGRQGGLGMKLIHGQVAKVGGRLDIERLQRGTKFKISF
jgi:PAS domain S-box-containing protein